MYSRFRTLFSIFGIATTLGLFSACQSAPAGYWFKQGIPEDQYRAEYRRDSYQCERESTQSYTMYNSMPMGNGVVTMPMPLQGVDANMFNRCMYSRGYEWSPQVPSPTIAPKPIVVAPKNERENDAAVCRQQASRYNDTRSFDEYARCMKGKGWTESRPSKYSAPSPSGSFQPCLPGQENWDDPSRRDCAKPVQQTPRSSGTFPERKLSTRPDTAELDPTQRWTKDAALCGRYSETFQTNTAEAYRLCMEDRGWPQSSR